MTVYSFELPEDFDDYEPITEAKGWYPADVTVAGRRYLLTFYDPVRLGQEIEAHLHRNEPFYEPNMIAIHTVNRLNMERAVTFIVEHGMIASLIPDEG